MQGGRMRIISDTDFLSSFLKIERLELVKDLFKNLGSGEKECLVLCKQFRDSMLLISDNKAREIANKNNIAVLNIPAFLLACKDAGLLDREDLATIIRDLKDKDYYEFSEGERDKLVV